MGRLAADMGAGEREILADEMHQQRARPAARCSARITMMPPTCLRYSTGPRASAAGDMIASAAAAAFCSEAGSRLVPITALAASSASSGVSDRLVRPIRQVVTLPPAIVSITAAAAVA